ncbi:hypothetical protein QYF36_025580 [Acer negundo]|nr:hypothetical protein QYF36_025580 [Acer negundo]
MEREDLSRQRRSSYLSGCMLMISPAPSCFPVHEDQMEYTRFHYCEEGSSSNKRGGRRWRNLLRKLVRDGKSINGSKHLSFHYDPVSYSQNFDEGSHHYEDSGRCPPVFRDVRWILFSDPTGLQCTHYTLDSQQQSPLCHIFVSSFSFANFTSPVALLLLQGLSIEALEMFLKECHKADL